MADPNTRQGKRTPVTLKIKFKSETLEQFIERYAVDVSQGGIFIRTKEPLAVGTQMKFEFQLRDASPLIAGEGTVVWTRENDPSRPAIAPGMGVRFDRLNEGSQSVLERILSEKAKQAPQRGGSEGVTKPPLFTDTPTRVAPAPVQEQLGMASSRSGGRVRADSQETPLPKPVPFHSDADDFDENAFQEATKVRSLDDLVAQTASSDSPSLVDELAQRRVAERGGRNDTTLSGDALDRVATVPDRDSAPGLPEPPAAERKPLDTSPSPRMSNPSTPPATKRPSGPIPATTKLGVEPARPIKTEPAPRVSSPRAAVAADSSDAMPAAGKRPSSAPIVLLILMLVAGAAAAVWFFVLRDNVADENQPVAKKPPLANPDPNPPPVNPPAGSDAVKTSPGSGGSATEVPPTQAAPTLETVVAASVPKATIEIEGTDQTGPAPLTAKLEKDKAYKAKVSAAGFVTQEIDLKGGQDNVSVKLVAKPHVISVSSEPSGASIYIDNAATGKQTPADIELSATQAAKAKLHVQLRKSGYKAFDHQVESASMTEDDAKLTAKVDARMVVQPVVVQQPRPPQGSGSGSATKANGSGAGAGSGEGSAATTPANTGSGAGSDTATPPPPPPPPPAGSGATTETKPPAGSGAGEPEPDWTKKQP